MSIIDLGIGHVNDTCLPLQELKGALGLFLEQSSSSCLQYAAEQGSRQLREKLARFLSAARPVAISADDVLITNGASHGLQLVLQHLGTPGDAMFVEDPTYFYALDIIRDRSLNVVPIATDEHGLCIASLREALQHHRPQFLYTIPTLHNPTGRTLSKERRRELVQLACEHDFWIVSDDVYELLDEPAAAPSMYGDAEQRVISLGSFSKIFGPGLRLGWILAPQKPMRQLLRCGVLRSGGGSSPLVCAIVEAAFDSGAVERCLSALRGYYGEQALFMAELMRRTLPRSVHFRAPRGGYFAWLEMPDGSDLTSIRARARQRGVDFKPGPQFSWNGNFKNCARLCFVYHDKSQLKLACERLGEVLT